MKSSDAQFLEVQRKAQELTNSHAAYQKQKFGRNYSAEDRREAAIDAAIAALGSGVPLDDALIRAKVEAALAERRRDVDRPRHGPAVAELVSDGGLDPEQLLERRRALEQSGVGPGMVVAPRAKVELPEKVPKQIADCLKAFERQVYHAIRSGALFRSRLVRVEHCHLKSIAFDFELSVLGSPKEPSAEDCAAWRALAQDERVRQIEATRDLYEGDAAARDQALQLVSGPEYRLVRSVFWRDGEINGEWTPGVVAVRRALREAEVSARTGSWNEMLAEVPATTLQRWIARLARRRSVDPGPFVRAAAALDDHQRQLVIDERTIYRRALRDVAQLAAVEINVDAEADRMAAFRRKILVVNCPLCSPESQWADCIHNAPEFDDKGAQIPGRAFESGGEVVVVPSVDFRGRGRRKPRQPMLFKWGASAEIVDRLPYVDHSSERRMEDAAERLATRLLNQVGIEPGVRHIGRRTKTRTRTRRIDRILREMHAANEKPDGSRHPAFRKRPANRKDN
jgi:hypothetical protein